MRFTNPKDIAVLSGLAGEPAPPKRKRSHAPGVMNKTESRFADYLEARRLRGEIKAWSFESDKFILADQTTFLVDFTVETNGDGREHYEIKGGYVREDSWLKLKIAAAMFPHETFYLAQWKRARVVRGKPVPAGWTIKRIKGA